MSLITKPIMLDETGQTSVQRLTELNTKMQQLADAIVSVRSVNGLTGDVVLDSTLIKVNKTSDQRTIYQLLSEEQTAVSNAVTTMQQAIRRTPVDFDTDQILDDDYLLTISLGTP